MEGNATIQTAEKYPSGSVALFGMVIFEEFGEKLPVELYKDRVTRLLVN